MAKYIIALTVLAMLAFENSSIQRRVYVESLPSVGAAVATKTTKTTTQTRDNQQYRAHLTNKLYASHNHRHKRTHHKPPPHQHHHNQNHNHQQNNAKIIKRRQSNDNFESKSTSDDPRFLVAEHLRRHQEHQREHLLHHNEHYWPPIISVSTSTSIESNENLKRLPRPWQHLSQHQSSSSLYDRMYGDAPYNNDDEVEAIVDDGYDDVAAAAEENEAKSDFKHFLENSSIPDSPLELFSDDEGFVDSVGEVVASESLDHTSNSVVSSNAESNDEEDKPIKIRHSSKTIQHRCPKCESQRQVEHVTQEELTRLRIEFVKTQILEKLRLKERPKVSVVALPKPIQEGVTIIDQGDERAKNKELDDYYARTSKKFIFLERETRNCKSTSVQKSICFSFKIDEADADGFDVNTAALWIFKKSLKHKRKQFQTQRNNTNNSNNNKNHTLINHEDIVVYEVQPPEDQEFQPVSKTIAIKRIDKNVSDKWLEIHIEWPIQRWFGNHDLSHLIQISCESCDINDIEDMISIDKDYRPFIMIDTQNRRRSSRQKRSINCTDGVTECCREKLYISFDEIGWGDWIIQPRGYDAYFCRGSCGTVASVTQSSSHHSSFVQKLNALNRGNGHKPLELIPCCTAKQYSSLQLVFMDTNNTATQKTFPNMVVESCGCR